MRPQGGWRIRTENLSEFSSGGTLIIGETLTGYEFEGKKNITVAATGVVITKDAPTASSIASVLSRTKFNLILYGFLSGTEH